MEGQGSKGDAIDTEKMENPDDSSGYQKMDQNKRQTLFASAAFIFMGKSCMLQEQQNPRAGVTWRGKP